MAEAIYVARFGASGVSWVAGVEPSVEGSPALAGTFQDDLGGSGWGCTPGLTQPSASSHLDSETRLGPAPPHGNLGTSVQVGALLCQEMVLSGL